MRRIAVALALSGIVLMVVALVGADDVAEPACTIQLRLYTEEKPKGEIAEFEFALIELNLPDPPKRSQSGNVAWTYKPDADWPGIRCVVITDPGNLTLYQSLDCPENVRSEPFIAGECGIDGKGFSGYFFLYDYSVGEYKASGWQYPPNAGPWPKGKVVEEIIVKGSKVEVKPIAPE